MSVTVGIIGAGPAGLAAAIDAQRQGLHAVVFERRTPPVDKACGEGIMPAGVRHLTDHLGVHLDRSACHTFSGIQWVDDTGAVARATFPSGVGLGVRRSTLHAALTERCEALNVDLRWGTTVRGLSAEGLSTDEGVVAVDWILGADGLHSKARGWAGIEVKRGRHARFGVRQHIGVAPESDTVEVHWSNHGEAYITPISDHEVGVAFLGGRGGASFEERLGQFPALQARYAGKPRTSPVRGAGPFHHRVRRPMRGQVMLIGDAAGYVDALTGEGVALAFHQATAALRALQTETPGRYVRDHRAITRRYRFTTRWMLALQRRPWLRRQVIGALSRDPDTFQTLLGFNEGHTGSAKLLSIAPRALWRGVLSAAHPPERSSVPLLPTSS